MKTSGIQGAVCSILGLLALATVVSCGPQGHESILPEGLGAAAPVPEADLIYEVAPPPWRGDDEIAADEIYPCSECHDPDDYDPERRELENAHRSIVLEHDEQHRWCLDCHDPENRDVLRLASGATVPFEESFRLCGQCHGSKFRDWRTGVHGRREGEWNGKKQYLLCVDCHDSHSPGFKPVGPEPAPVRPGAQR